MTDQCEAQQSAMNAALVAAMKAKVNTLAKCDAAAAECPCTATGGDKGDVDLVLLIDSSSSMNGPANDLAEAAASALQNAIASCGANVRTEWLYLKGGTPKGAVDPDTSLAPFHQEHAEYLTDVTPGAAIQNTHAEGGALGIADVASYFDWRENACRAIIYFTDTGIHAGGSDESFTQTAIDQAVANDVTVFIHNSALHFASADAKTESLAQYTQIADATGGIASLEVPASEALYETMLEQAVCTCGGGCEALELFDARPCISIRWGDSECDAFETDDLEKLYITVSNCYGNISFSDVSIGAVTVTDAADAPVALLPDGTPSVDILPTGPICFGEIPACQDGVPGAVTREFSIHTRGAIEGDYKISLGSLCYDINTRYSVDACFAMKLCRS